LTPLAPRPDQWAQLVDDLPGFGAGGVELFDSLRQLLFPLRPGLTVATLTLLVTLTRLILVILTIAATTLELDWLCHVLPPFRENE